MTNVIFTNEQYAAAVERFNERFKKKHAARQAAKEALERISDGASRSTFGKFTASFEEVAPDIGRSRTSARMGGRQMRPLNNGHRGCQKKKPRSPGVEP